MNKNKTYFLTTCALMAALFCILAPMSVPIGPVPVSLTGLVLYLSIMLLGTKGTLVSYGVYILLGLVGLPVFSGYSGGAAKLAGPTGGYLIGFFLTIFICGYAKDKSKVNVWITMLGMVIGTLVAYIFGTVWFVIMMQCEVGYAISVCVIPFIPFDIAKIVLAVFLGKKIRAALMHANLLQE